MNMNKYFGTDGIRFIYDESCHELLIKVAKAITNFPLKEIIIGMDTRESSPIITKILCSNINKKISFIGITSTPCISFLFVMHRHFSASKYIIYNTRRKTLIQATACCPPSTENGLLCLFP